jgi:2-dehydro-3-deoxyphosphogluconate aldolase/(4S)-4-hydroxy-2-oxoglutarate aldolase
MVEGLVPAVVRGGLRQLEITMNTDGAVGLIRAAVELAGGRMNVGAGTVLTLGQLEAALEAGANFIVTPVVGEAVIRRCVELGVPVFPGAYTLGEIVRAWELGATMVKVFPADFLPVEFFRGVKAEWPEIKLMPTGGVSLASLPTYRGCVDGYGVGSPLFHAERLARSDWGWVEEQTREWCDATRRWRVGTGAEG